MRVIRLFSSTSRNSDVISAPDTVEARRLAKRCFQEPAVTYKIWKVACRQIEEACPDVLTAWVPLAYVLWAWLLLVAARVKRKLIIHVSKRQEKSKQNNSELIQTCRIMSSASSSAAGATANVPKIQDLAAAWPSAFFFKKKKVVTEHPLTAGQLRVAPSRCDQLDTQRQQKRAADMKNCQRSDTSTLHRPAAATWQ